MDERYEGGSLVETEGKEVIRTRWFVITDKALEMMLDRAKKGEDPEMLLIELYANSVSSTEAEAEAAGDDDLP